MLSFPANLDLTKIPALKPFLLTEESSTQNNNVFDFIEKDRESQLNNSIRKKLFDQNSDDLSTSTTTTSNTATNNNVNNINNHDSNHEFMSPTHFKLQILMGSNYNKQKTPNTLPRPEISSSDNEKVNKIKNSQNKDDEWSDSFDFGDDDHQFASSPKSNRFSKIMHDIGDDIYNDNDDNLNDSVFLNNQQNQQRTPPDLSPLLATPKKQIIHNHPQNDSSPIESCNNLYSKNLQHQHHNRYFHFDTSKLMQTPQNHNHSRTIADIGSGLIDLKNNTRSTEKSQQQQINSPNLSPIRTSSSSANKKSMSSSKKSMSSSSKKSSFVVNPNDSNNTNPQQHKSIIFMDVGNGEHINIPERDNEEIQDRSFSESLSQHENHYKREEFYTNKLYHDKLESGKRSKDTTTIVSDSNQNLGDKQQQSFLIPVYQSDTSVQDQSSKLINNTNSNGNNLNLQNQFTKNSKYVLDSSSKQPMNSMIETTTNTFNLDSQDTGYQTTSANCGANGSSSSSISCFQTSSNPSMMLFTDNYNSNTTTNKLFPLTTSLFELNNISNKNTRPNKLFTKSNKQNHNNNNHNHNNVSNNNSTNQATVTSTPMSIGEDELFNFNSYDYDSENNKNHFQLLNSKPSSNNLIFNFNLPKLANLNTNNNINKEIKNNSSSKPLTNKNLNSNNTKLNTSSTLAKSHSNNSQNNRKKASISLNSLENIKPVESSTPEKLKQSITSFKLKLKSSILSSQNELSHNNINTIKSKSTNFVKSKTSGNLVSNSLKQKKSSKSSSKASFSSTNLITDEYLDCNEYEDDAYMSFNNTSSYSNDQQLINNKKKSSSQQVMTISCEDLSKNPQLMLKKYELDSSYMDQSILMNKISPSEYARSVLDRAKKYLNESNKYLESESNLQNDIKI